MTDDEWLFGKLKSVPPGWERGLVFDEDGDEDLHGEKLEFTKEDEFLRKVSDILRSRSRHGRLRLV